MQSSHTHRFLLSFGALLLSSSLGESGAPRRQEGEAHEALQLEALKAGILDHLGMDRPPEPRERASPHKLSRMNRQYRSMMQLLRGNSSRGGESQPTQRVSAVLLPTTVEQLKVEKNNEAPMGSETHWYRAVFHKSPLIRKDLTLVQAELKLHRESLDDLNPSQSQGRQEIQANMYKMGGLASPPLHMESIVVTKGLNTQNVTLDIGVEIEKWRLQSGDTPLVVDVGIVTGDGMGPQTAPQIVMEIATRRGALAGRRRRARSAKEHSCEDEGKCCRKSLTVSFEEIGWSDWVVAPADYNMHFCDGSCPHNYKPASMHTQVKSRLHHLTKGATPRPCCVPATYEPMILMHYDSRGKLKLTPFNDLIVSKCHCA